MKSCCWSVALLAFALQTAVPELRTRRGGSLPAPPSSSFADSLPELWQQLRSSLSADNAGSKQHHCATGTIDTLVLEGGGVKGIAHGGAVCALQSAGLLSEIHTFRGTSAGSVAAALLASGMGCDGMHTALWEIDFNTLAPSGGIFSSLELLRTQFGLHDGAQIQAHVERLLAAQLGNRAGNITFAQLRRKTGKELQITATSVTTSRLTFFDADRTPHVPVALAVRASSTIPVFFTPAIIDGEMFVDGGLLRNMPIDSGDDGFTSSGAILALGLRSEELRLLGVAKKPQEAAVASLQEFVRALYRAVIWGPDSANSLLATRQPNVEYLPIDTRGVNGIDFSLAAAQKRELVSSGFVAVMGQLLRCGRTEWPRVPAAAITR
jgi:NTE family protein